MFFCIDLLFAPDFLNVILTSFFVETESELFQANNVVYFHEIVFILGSLSQCDGWVDKKMSCIHTMAQQNINSLLIQVFWHPHVYISVFDWVLGWNGMLNKLESYLLISVVDLLVLYIDFCRDLDSGTATRMEPYGWWIVGSINFWGLMTITCKILSSLVLLWDLTDDNPVYPQLMAKDARVCKKLG